MSTSGSVNYTITGGDIITHSLRLLRVLKPGQSASSEMVNDGLEFLNMLVKAWQADGLQLWAVKSASLTLTVDTSSYSLGPTGDIVMNRPLRVLSARLKDSSGNETPVAMVSREEYDNLNLKTTDGKINQVYYDPQLTNGVLYVWPEADDATDTLEITYHRPFEDFDYTSDTPDFPQEWYLAIVYGLASLLCNAYPTEDPIAISRVRKDADKFKEQVLTWSTEDDSIYFSPGYVHGYN